MLSTLQSGHTRHVGGVKRMWKQQSRVSSSDTGSWLRFSVILQSTAVTVGSPNGLLRSPAVLLGVCGSTVVSWGRLRSTAVFSHIACSDGLAIGGSFDVDCRAQPRSCRTNSWNMTTHQRYTFSVAKNLRPTPSFNVATFLQQKFRKKFKVLHRT